MISRGQEIPIQVVGSSKFGIYPKISLEKTYNMFVSDNWLINYAGYKRITQAITGSEGRGLFHSIRGDFLIGVIDNQVYRFNEELGAQLVGLINTRLGEVFIDENLASQICIVDGNDAWIYNYDAFTFTQQTLNVGGFNVIPGYVTYHNSFFLLAPSINDPNNTNNWYAFQRDTDSTIALVVDSVFPLQTKPDNCLAIKRLPGRANHVLVIGSSVCEIFTQVGGAENYRRTSSFNIDSGCVSISTIAANEQFICFLAQNENNSPVLMYTNGSEIKEISTDGINNLLKLLNRPDQSTAFFYKQDGHLFYQITFFDPDDNLTLAYDFNTNSFYHITDDKRNFHPARQIAYFNKKNIFIGLKGGGLYEMSIEIDGAYENIDTGEGNTIERIRVTPTLRFPSSSPFIVRRLQLWLEQGINQLSEIDSNVVTNLMITEEGDPMITEDGDLMVTEDPTFVSSIEVRRPRVDLSVSKNGNQSFSNIVRRELNYKGKFRNEMRWHQLGFANEITFQFRFWGLNRFVVNNALVEVGQ